MQKLRGPHRIEFIENELNELKAEREAQTNQNQITFKDLLFTRDLRKPLIAAIVIQISQVECCHIYFFPIFNQD